MPDEISLSASDLARLADYDPWGSADSLHERNWCNSMEAKGLLKYGSGDCSGSRSYDITAAGLAALGGGKLARFDPCI
jgi:hypothetical protein